jgi:ribosomal protein L4
MLKLNGSCLLITAAYNKNLLLSTRNVPGAGVAVASDLNAYEILKHRWLVIEKEALVRLAGVAS